MTEAELEERIARAIARADGYLLPTPLGTYAPNSTTHKYVRRADAAIRAMRDANQIPAPEVE